MEETTRKVSNNSTSYSKTAARAGRWLIALQVVAKLAGILQKVVLARLIAVDDFGAMGVALLAISGAEVLTTPGMSQALIQKKGGIKEYFDTYWTCQVARGAIITLVLGILAPYIAAFMQSPESEHIIRWTALIIFVRALKNPALVLFQKQIEFKPRFIMTSYSSIVGAIAAIAYAVVNRDVWALVVGLFVSNMLEVMISYRLYPCKPVLKVDGEKLRELLSFGGWVWVSSVLVFLVTQGDDIVVARILGITALGLYGMAYWLANLPATQIVHLVSNITFPIYSKIQDDPERIGAGYIKTLQSVLLVTVPFSVALIVLAEPATRVILGEKWIEIAAPLKFLAVAGMLRCISSTMGPVFLAMGRPRTVTVGQVLRFLVLAATIIPLVRDHKMMGASFAVVLSSSAALAYYLVMVLKLVRISFARFVRMIAALASGGIVLAALLYGLSVTVENEVLLLVLSAVVGSSVYLFAVNMVDRLAGSGIRRMLFDFLGILHHHGGGEEK